MFYLSVEPMIPFIGKFLTHRTTYMSNKVLEKVNGGQSYWFTIVEYQIAGLILFYG